MTQSTTFAAGTVVTKEWLNAIDTHVFSVQHYGAVGDGVTDDTAAILAAIAASANGKLVFPAGEYIMSGGGGNLATLDQPIQIVGVGAAATVIRFRGSAAYFNGFKVDSPNVTIRDLTLSCEPTAGNQVAAISLGDSDFTMDGVVVDGTVTYSTSFSHTAYGINIATGTANNDVLINACTFKRSHFPLLKSNANTSTQERWKYSNCRFTGNFREDLGLNSPLGYMRDVVVYGCHFDDHQGIAAGQDSIQLPLASVTQFSIIGNTFRGPIREAIHMEYACEDGVVSGNVIACEFADQGGGITMLENDTNGLPVIPVKNVTITGNTVRHTGTAKATDRFGIWAINNGSDDVPGEQFIITGNTVENFDVGISWQCGNGGSATVSNNIAGNCATGYRSQQSSSIQAYGNISRNCDLGVKTVDGGTFADHRFADCTTNADATSAFPLVLVNPRFEFNAVAFTASETKNFNLFPLASSSRMYGFGSTHINSNLSPRYSTRVDELTYDGATLTVTNKMLLQPSSVQSTLQLNTGNFRCQVFSSAALSAACVSAWINGHVVIEL